MILSVLGASPGEALIILFSDGSLVTIDCCKRKNINYSVEYIKENNLDEGCVKYNIFTHFHDDHIRGASELIEFCHNSTIVIPDIWRSDEFKRFAALFDTNITLARGTIIRELLKIFELISNKGREVLFAAELTVLHPSPGVKPEGTQERLTVLSPSAPRKTQFLTGLASALDESDSGARRFGLTDVNDTSLSFLLQQENDRIFLGGDLQNLPPHRDIDHMHETHDLPCDPYKLVKMPHHGSATSFSDNLRARISNEDTAVLITPYPRGGKSLPNPETEEHLNGVVTILVLAGEVIGLDRADRLLEVPGVVPIREYRPGRVEYCDRSIAHTGCVDLKAYLHSSL